MPDITMCRDDGCPKKDTCYRYTAEPTPRRQSYFSEPPLEGEECEYYWPWWWNDKGDEIKDCED